MNLRKLAKGKPCMIRLPGICCANPDTTVLAHFRMSGLSGMSMKSPDLFGAWACAKCHDAVDGRTRVPFSHEYLELALLHGVMRTQYELLDSGVLTI